MPSARVREDVAACWRTNSRVTRSVRGSPRVRSASHCCEGSSETSSTLETDEDEELERDRVSIETSGEVV